MDRRNVNKVIERIREKWIEPYEPNATIEIRNGMDIRIFGFEAFGNPDAKILKEICEEFDVSWCIFNHSGKVEISMFSLRI